MTEPYPNVFESYEENRDRLAVWLRRNLIEEFDLRRYGTSLLDVGAGEGFWADLFHREGFEVSAFDVEPEYVKAGERKYPHLDLWVGDAENAAEAAAGGFDIVVCRAISHFYAADLADARVVVENLFDWARPGGVVVGMIYTDGSGKALPGVFGGKLVHYGVGEYLNLFAYRAVVRHARVGNYLTIAVEA